MMKFHYSAVLLLYYFATGAESMFIAPTIFQGNEAVVNTGDNLTLPCQGVEPLTWTIVNYNKINYDKNSIIKSEINEKNSQLLYRSILRIQNVSYLNTGFFYCHGRKANKDDILRSTNIYVYVKDEMRLSLVPLEEIAVFLEESKTKLTIPCMPTSPDIKVDLLSYTFEKEAESNFDPRIGFTLTRPVRVSGDPMYCMFTRNDQNETTTVILSEYSLPETSLVYDPSGKYIAYIGNKLVLRCSIIMPNNFIQLFEWTLNNKFINKDNRISIKNNPLISIVNGKLLTSSIIINNITKEDEGQYECYSVTYTDLEGKASAYITVTDIAKEIAPPKINFTGSEIIIHAQESLTLLCNGTEPINWFADDLNILMNNINITTYKESKYIFKAILTISNATVECAGSYVCKSEHVETNNPFRTRKIYIYVKDRNYLSNYVGDLYEAIFIMWNTRSYIPCVPFSPDVNVSLIDSEGHKIQSDIATYSPKLGFNFFAKDRGLRNFTCLYQRGNITQEMTLSILVIKDPIHEETHLLEGPKKESIYKGKILLLNCSIIIYDAVMFNYSDLFLNWTIPESLETGDNLLIEDEKSYQLATGKVLLKQLTVKNADSGAEGDYECVLYDRLLNQVSSVSKYITILEQINADLVIDIPERKYIVTSETLILNCDIKVNHNVKFTLYWSYNKNIQNVNRISQTSLKIKEDISGLIGSIYLTIKNVTLEDAGIYKCTMKNDLDFSKFIERNIIIHEPKSPDIYETNLNNSEWKIQEGESINLYCKTIGKPVPVITWIKNDRPWEFERSRPRVIIQNNNTSVNFTYTRKEDEGTYRCRVSNIAGEVENGITLTILTDQTKWTTTQIAFIVVLIIVLTVLLIILVIKIIKEKKRKREFEIAGLHQFEQGAIYSINPNLGVDSQAELLPYDKSHEIPREKLKLGKQLGSGFFGIVIQANAVNIFPEEKNKIVAVKMVKSGAEYSHIQALLCELKIMIHLGKHLNVVNLLGACTRNIAKRELLVIVEYCRYGNILNYLLKYRNNFINQLDSRTGCINTSIGKDVLKYYASAKKNPELLPHSCYYNVIESDEIYSNITKAQTDNYDNIIKSVCTHDLLSWSFQIAQGMNYLASRKVLHGDLAARNILLADNNIVKICDFGLAKNIYKYSTYKKKTNGPLPVKWMAPESITNRVFSTQSDVWSYGIVLWELFSLARTPYPDIEVNQQFYEKLLNGYRMSQPEYSNNEIYRIMLTCWQSSPSDRPSFSALSDRISSMLTTHDRQHFIELNQPYAHQNNLKFKNNCDFLGTMRQPDCNNLILTSNITKEICSANKLNNPNADSEIKNKKVMMQYSTLDFHSNILQDDIEHNFDKYDSNSNLQILTTTISSCDTSVNENIFK